MDRSVCRRSAAKLAAWVLLLTLATGIAAAQVAPPPVSSDFEVVEVDLNGQIFNRVLPFDVPFILTGAVPAGITSLRVRCWVFDIDRKSRKPRPAHLTPDVLKQSPDGNCWDGEPLVWNNTIDPATPNPKFRVLVPPLTAEKSYQFSFTFVKKITPQEAQAFAPQVQGIVDPVLWGDPRKTADLPLVSDILTDEEVAAIRQQLIRALKEVTGADRFPEPGTIFNEETPFAAVRNEFNRLLLPVRNAQGQIDATAETYQAEIANLNPLLQGIRADPTLQRLGGALAARAATEPSLQAYADQFAAALAVADAPVLLRRDRQSAAALAAFAQSGASYFSDASAKVGKLRALLAGKLIAADGSPQPALAPLIAAGQLSRGDLASLAAMAQDRGPVGSADRALKRVGSSVLANLQRSLDDRRQAVAAVAEAYRTRVENMIVAAGSTTGSFQTQSNNYISADTGVACAPELSSCSTYAGTNIYFRPVNKAAPLSQFGGFFSKESLSRRVSVTLGLTVNGIGDSGKTREDLFGNQSLVVGLGARLTNSVRLTAGSLVFKKLSPNPLNEDKKLTTTYFLSISFDIDVVPTLKGIGTLFRP